MLSYWDDFYSPVVRRDYSRGSGEMTSGTGTTDRFYPHFDVKENEHHIIVHADLPGMKKQDIKISFDNNNLCICGERKNEFKQEGDKWHRFERTYGSFSRTIRLPEGICGQEIKANYCDGVLMLEIPKPKKTKQEAHHINIA